MAWDYTGDQDQGGLFALPPWLAARRAITPPFLDMSDANAVSGAQAASPDDDSAFKPPEKVARTATPLDVSAAPQVQAASAEESLGTPSGPNLDADVYGGRVARPEESQYPAAKIPLWRRIAGAAAGGMEGYATKDGVRGAELGRGIIDQPERRREQQISRDQQQWEQARTRGAQAAQPPAAATPAPATGVIQNNGDDAAANTAASLQKIANDQAAGRSTYGGPTGATAAGAGGTAQAPALKPKTAGDAVFNDLMTGNNGQPRVNPKTNKPYTSEEALAASRTAGHETPESREQLEEKLARMRADLKRAGTGSGGGAAGPTAETDLGAAPAGKAEGSTGTLPNGHKVVVKNGHLWEQLPTPAATGKGASGPTNTTRSRGEMASTVVKHIPTLNSEIDGISSEIGPVAGRWNDWWVNKAGVNDPKFAALDQDLFLFASGIAVAHFGARGGGAKYIEALEQRFRTAQSPEDLKARIASSESWMMDYAAAGGGR
jgi:hypothetical protein